MYIEAIKSKIITPQDDVIECLKIALQGRNIEEGDIIVITSKVLAITQGALQPIDSQEAFDRFVEEEADEVLGGNPVTLTMKDEIYIPWAGVDKSNVPNDTAVAWPRAPFNAAWEILQALKKHYEVKNLGVIITESMIVPRRRGTFGIAIGYAGFKGVKDYRGTQDLYHKDIKFSQLACADMLATAANYLMEETNQSRPFALIRGAKVAFTDAEPDPKESVMPADECVFKPFYDALKHQKD